MTHRPDMDSLVVQEERGFPDINMITEKVAFQGITRFEDRGRMPLGSVFNVTSFSARILSQAMYNPKVPPVTCRLSVHVWHSQKRTPCRGRTSVISCPCLVCCRLETIAQPESFLNGCGVFRMLCQGCYLCAQSPQVSVCGVAPVAAQVQ